jgi:NAD(P)-dependent dehydrogenase (short-subunit alcohol dehydrogenase family)
LSEEQEEGKRGESRARSEAEPSEAEAGKPVALVTGGGTGIGAACCRALAAEGFRVGVHYRSSEDKARAVAQACGDAFAILPISRGAERRSRRSSPSSKGLQSPRPRRRCSISQRGLQRERADASR